MQSSKCGRVGYKKKNMAVTKGRYLLGCETIHLKLKITPLFYWE